MIKEIREQEPFIHFGFNRQSIIAYTNMDVIVWQDKIYINDYDENITSSGATVVSSGLNKSVLNFDTAGSYTITFSVQDKDKTITKVSNVLNIEVVDITYGTTDILWGNTEITFND